MNVGEISGSNTVIEKSEWRGWDLNPHPRAYESPAPPLSYLAILVRV
jgi:hypothetical protein